MELILHYMYVVAIKDTKAWVGYTPAQISMVGFWNLIIVWLKVTPVPGSDRRLLTMNLAIDTMALFPTMGVIRWYRPTGEHGEVYGE